jgi:hypothetical protein
MSERYAGSEAQRFWYEDDYDEWKRLRQQRQRLERWWQS